MFENLQRDSTKYPCWYTAPGFWIIAIYRLGVWADSRRSPLLRIPLWLLYRFLRAFTLMFNVDVWAGGRGARIGPGVRLIHPTNIIIGGSVEIGEDCLIFHDVTLGTGLVPGTPKIGRGVDIYPGARILGGVTVGDHSVVGANCVVTRDVPPESVVLSAPSKTIPRTLSPVARAGDRAGVE